MADQAEHVVKDAAYFDELRRAVGRAAPTALLGTPSPAIDQSIDDMEELELKKRPDVYSDYYSYVRNLKHFGTWVPPVAISVSGTVLLAVAILFAIITTNWVASVFEVISVILAGSLVIVRVDRRHAKNKHREIRHALLPLIKSGPPTGTSESGLGVQKRDK